MATLDIDLIDLHDLLVRMSEFLDNYTDVEDGDDGRPVPNKAMRLKGEVDELIEAVGTLPTPAPAAVPELPTLPVVVEPVNQSQADRLRRPLRYLLQAQVPGNGAGSGVWDTIAGFETDAGARRQVASIRAEFPDSAISYRLRVLGA